MSNPPAPTRYARLLKWLRAQSDAAILERIAGATRAELLYLHGQVGFGACECDCEIVWLPCPTCVDLERRIARARGTPEHVELQERLAEHRPYCTPPLQPCEHVLDPPLTMPWKFCLEIAKRLWPDDYADRPWPAYVRADVVVADPRIKADVMRDRQAGREGLWHPADCCMTGLAAQRLLNDMREDVIHLAGGICPQCKENANPDWEAETATCPACGWAGSLWQLPHNARNGSVAKRHTIVVKGGI